MPSDPVKMTKAYLALWKALDVYFPGHPLLEIAPESPEELVAEVELLAKDDISEWTSHPSALKREIDKTLKRVREKNKDQRWFSEARILKDFFQEQALRYSKKLRGPTERYLIADVAIGKKKE